MKRNTALGLATLLSLIGIIVVLFVQLTAEKDIPACSYLDPITMDILAFSVTLFIIIEGTYHILEKKQDTAGRQWCRAIRVAAGMSIFAVHVLQFMHK